MRKVLVVLEVDGVSTPHAVQTREEWLLACEALRAGLVANFDAGRCGSVVVSVHFADERCDHEVG